MPKRKKLTSNLSLRVFHYKKFLLLIGITVFLVIGIWGINAYKNHWGDSYDSSLTGEEAIETQQNEIPSDVVDKLKEQRKVLSMQISRDSIQAVALPSSVRVPILMYHYVEYVQDPRDKTRISLNTRPNTLEQEIKTLFDAGYTFMTIGELTDVLNGEQTLPVKPVVLTFDDSYRDFYTDAYPILKKYNAKATQYAIAGFLDRPNHLLTWQLQEIANDGLVEIGAHTAHHVWLKGQTLKTVQYEVEQSKKILEESIHKPVISFAYPFGAFDVQAVSSVQKAGFKTATSTIPGIDQPQTNRYFLYRLRPGGRTGQTLLTWLDHVHN